LEIRRKGLVTGKQLEGRLEGKELAGGKLGLSATSASFCVSLRITEVRCDGREPIGRKKKRGLSRDRVRGVRKKKRA